MYTQTLCSAIVIDRLHLSEYVTLRFSYSVVTISLIKHERVYIHCIDSLQVQSDAEKEDPLKKLVDPVEKDAAESQVVEKKEEEAEDKEEEVVKEEEDNEEEEDEEDQSDEDKEKSDEESPTHVPKKGMFYQHDDRNYVNPDDENKRSRGPRVDNTGRTWGGKKEKKWVHDMFDEDEQKPKEDVRCDNLMLFFIRLILCTSNLSI